MTLRCGDSRCVGAHFTCAGAWELALPCTAVVLFPIHIVTYVHTHIKPEIYTKKMSEFVQYMYTHIYSYFVHYVIYLFKR